MSSKNKKLFPIIVSLFLIFSLFMVACSSSSNQEQDEDKRFLKAYGDRYGNIIMVDTQTKVQYYYHRDGYSGGLTVLVDENGNPLLYED